MRHELKKARENAGLTQEKMAEKLGILPAHEEPANGRRVRVF